MKKRWHAWESPKQTKGITLGVATYFIFPNSVTICRSSIGYYYHLYTCWRVLIATFAARKQNTFDDLMPFKMLSDLFVFLPNRVFIQYYIEPVTYYSSQAKMRNEISILFQSWEDISRTDWSEVKQLEMLNFRRVLLMTWNFSFGYLIVARLEYTCTIQDTWCKDVLKGEYLKGNWDKWRTHHEYDVPRKPPSLLNYMILGFRGTCKSDFLGTTRVLEDFLHLVWL